MREDERRVATANPAPDTIAQSTTPHTEFDFDKRVADQIDWSIWRAIRAGEFRLAVRCRRCQRRLVDGRSKRRHLGAVCAARVAAEAVS